MDCTLWYHDNGDDDDDDVDDDDDDDDDYDDASDDDGEHFVNRTVEEPLRPLGQSIARCIFQLSRRDREFLPFSLMLRDEIENFFLSVLCFETRSRISVF